MKFIKDAVGFVKGAYQELKKVSWLSRQEMIASTAVVIVLVILVAIFVGAVDFFLSWVLGILL